MLGKMWLHMMSSGSLVGANQFAYRPEHGSRDALAYAILRWLRAFYHRKKIGVHLADVSGAFDRVSVPRMLRKLRAKKIPEALVQVIGSWLRQRQAVVVVSGQKSVQMKIENSVYQGTVWGPPLWSLFYEDTTEATSRAHFYEVKYADDLSACREFDNQTSRDVIHESINNCAKELHAWGEANQVKFDPTKESRAILSAWNQAAEGSSFELLGVIIDPQLTMKPAIEALVKKCRWKLASVLRCRRFYCPRQ